MNKSTDAVRSCHEPKKGGSLLRAAAVLALLLLVPSVESLAATGSVAVSAPVQTGPLPTIYQSPESDLRVKVWGGEIAIHRGFASGKWHPNLNWMPLSFTYDSFDNSIKTITRSRTDYGKAAAGVYQDQNGNLLRQTANGFRWNNPAGDWIDYNPAGEIKAYGTRNGTVATFQYTGGSASTTAGVPASEGRISGILDHHGAQALWLDYDAGNQLIRVRDAGNRKTEYQWTTGGSHTVLDPDGHTWTYTVTGQGAGITVTDPDNHATARTWHSNGQLSGLTLADGSKTTTTQDYDSAKNTLYTRETAPGGKITETWSDLNQDRGRGEYQRRDINGITVDKQSLDTATRTTTHTDARGLDTAITRDQWKNITRIRYPDGSTAENQYTPGTGNRTRHTDENATTT